MRLEQLAKRPSVNRPDTASPSMVFSVLRAANLGCYIGRSADLVLVAGGYAITDQIYRYGAGSQAQGICMAPKTVLPDSRFYAICRDDDVTFGILSSRMHEVWALAQASRHGVGNDPTYNAKDCFETFPFPKPDKPSRELVVIASKRLNELRENWLNPSDWVHRVPEVVPGYPDRIVAKAGHDTELKKRTITALYNTRPSWLVNAHRDLDAAVAAAYGWPDYTPETSDEEILRRLLDLNLTRASGPGFVIASPP